MSQVSDRLSRIPQISVLLEDERILPWLAAGQRGWMTRLVQSEVDALREELRTARGRVRERGELIDLLCGRIAARRKMLLAPSWTRVLNGTGVVVHTNLGRSCFPQSAADAAWTVARYNSDLEFDLEEGVRGHRGRRVEEKLALLADAPDALIVNNNAAAVWLAVRYLSRGGRVVLSRGEIVAIGGSFRIHEILAETGCTLVEVGTTNRTSVEDYRQALGPDTIVLKVHRSNFSVEGFTEEVGLPELAGLCREHDCPLVYDAGSGALYPYEKLGLPTGERLLAEDLAAGADLVTCSGDKLLGGCQAGAILGSSDHVAGLRKHPMRRAFRVDKTTLAALDDVLTHYLATDDRPEVPTLEQLGATLPQLQEKAEGLLEKLAPLAPARWHGTVVPGRSSVGGGSFSSTTIESRLVLFEASKKELERVHQELRRGDPALVGRMNQEGLAVDVRTLDESDLDLVVAAYRRAWESIAPNAGKHGSNDD